MGYHVPHSESHLLRTWMAFICHASIKFLLTLNFMMYFLSFSRNLFIWNIFLNTHTHTHIHTSFFHLLVYPKKAAKLKWSMSGLGWRREPGPLFMSPSWVAGALMFRPVFCFPDVNRGWIRSGMSIQDLNWCSCGILVSKVVAQLLHHNDDSDVYSFQK